MNITVTDTKLFIDLQDFNQSRDFDIALGWRVTYDLNNLRVLEFGNHYFYVHCDIRINTGATIQCYTFLLNRGRTDLLLSDTSFATLCFQVICNTVMQSISKVMFSRFTFKILLAC